MGADLYIMSLYDENQAAWANKFQEAVNRRNELPVGSPERAMTQFWVQHCLKQMQGNGYFRDPYNPYDLLQQFGLAWEDIIPMLDQDSKLSVAQTTALLNKLKEREDVFEERIKQVSLSDGKHFRKRYADLRDFLKRAIALGEPIQCSL
jgi:hypothetical protein